MGLPVSSTILTAPARNSRSNFRLFSAMTLYPLRSGLHATGGLSGEYLRQQQAILASHGTTARDKTAAGRQLYEHAHNHRDLLNRIAQAVTATRVPYREL
jgi:hypothetical protein